MNLKDMVDWALFNYSEEEMSKKPINEAVLEFKLHHRAGMKRSRAEGVQEELTFEREVDPTLN